MFDFSAGEIEESNLTVAHLRVDGMFYSIYFNSRMKFMNYHGSCVSGSESVSFTTSGIAEIAIDEINQKKGLKNDTTSH